jgi:hypothetical protein
MIRLTNPIPVNTVLGSSSKTNYDTIELVSLNYDVVSQTIGGTCRVVCSGTPTAAPILGSYFIPTANGLAMSVSVPTLPFYAQILLDAAQQAVVQGWIQAAQNTVEAGLVAVGVVAGTQPNGL